MKKTALCSVLALLLILCALCIGCAEPIIYPRPNGPADPDYLPEDGSLPVVLTTSRSSSRR